MQIDYSLTDIKLVACKVLEELKGEKCIAFFAPMGAGKTTLIHALCQELGVVDNVSSPTYSIINEYETNQGEKLVHMDWYRLKDETDALNAGVEDYLRGGAYCFVEWPERAPSLLPANCFRLQISVTGDDKRSIRFLQIN